MRQHFNSREVSNCTVPSSEIRGEDLRSFDRVRIISRGSRLGRDSIEWAHQRFR